MSWYVVATKRLIKKARFWTFVAIFFCPSSGKASLACSLAHSKTEAKRRHKDKPIFIKKHGRKAKSVFRYGFDDLRNMLRAGQLLEPFFAQVTKFIASLCNQNDFIQFYSKTNIVG